MGTSQLANHLISDGILKHSDCKMIAKDSGHGGAAFAKVIIALGVFKEKQLAQYIHDKTGHPLLPFDKLIESSPEAIGIIDAPLIAHLEVLPVSLNGKTLSVAMADPLDQAIINQLRFFTEYQIAPEIATFSSIYRTLGTIIENFSPAQTSLEGFLKSFNFTKNSHAQKSNSENTKPNHIQQKTPKPPRGPQPEPLRKADYEDSSLGEDLEDQYDDDEEDDSLPPDFEDSPVQEEEEQEAEQPKALFDDTDFGKVDSISFDDLVTSEDVPGFEIEGKKILSEEDLAAKAESEQKADSDLTAEPAAQDDPFSESPDEPDSDNAGLEESLSDDLGLSMESAETNSPPNNQATESIDSTLDPDSLEASETPDDLDSLEASETPDDLDSLEASETPDDLDSLEASDTPDDLDSLEASDTPDDLDSLEASDTPDDLDSLEANETPDDLDSLEASETPDDLDSLEANETPDNLDSLEASDTPDDLDSHETMPPPHQSEDTPSQEMDETIETFNPGSANSSDIPIKDHENTVQAESIPAEEQSPVEDHQEGNDGALESSQTNHMSGLSHESSEALLQASMGVFNHSLMKLNLNMRMENIPTLIEESFDKASCHEGAIFEKVEASKFQILLSWSSQPENHTWDVDKDLIALLESAPANQWASAHPVPPALAAISTEDQEFMARSLILENQKEYVTLVLAPLDLFSAEAFCDILTNFLTKAMNQLQQKSSPISSLEHSADLN